MKQSLCLKSVRAQAKTGKFRRSFSLLASTSLVLASLFVVSGCSNNSEPGSGGGSSSPSSEPSASAPAQTNTAPSEFSDEGIPDPTESPSDAPAPAVFQLNVERIEQFISSGQQSLLPSANRADLSSERFTGDQQTAVANRICSHVQSINTFPTGTNRRATAFIAELTQVCRSQAARLLKGDLALDTTEAGQAAGCEGFARESEEANFNVNELRDLCSQPVSADRQRAIGEVMEDFISHMEVLTGTADTSADDL